RVVVLARDGEQGPVRLSPPHPEAARGRMTVRVVDGAGEAVAGARVEVFGWSRQNVEPDVIGTADRVPLARGDTDGEGRFGAELPGLESGVAFASGPDGSCGRSRFTGLHGEASALVVVLEPPAS